jgi:hypothetical protein
MNKEETVVFEAAGDQVKRTFTLIDADGQSINSPRLFHGNGKEHKVDGPNGAPPAMVAVEPVNDRTFDVTIKVNGKVVATGTSVVSKDEKTMTSQFKGEDPKGRKFDNTEAMEKQ